METRQNLDAGEQLKFNALASEWWDPNGRLAILHDINPTRLGYIKKHTDIANKKILDVGCGGGILTESMAKHGGLVTGIDISTDIIEIAEHHARQAELNITYLCTTIEELCYEQENTYDIVTCMELLEHVPSPTSVINACNHLIKPSGLFFLSTINRNLKSYFQTKIMAEYLLRLLSVGTHEYQKYSLPSEVACWCRKADFTVINVSGISYLPFLRQSWLTDEPDVNYLLCAQAMNHK